MDQKSLTLGDHEIITIGKGSKVEAVGADLKEVIAVHFDDDDFPNSSLDSMCRIVILYNHISLHDQIVVPTKNRLEFEQLFSLMLHETLTSQSKQTSSILSLMLQTLLLKIEELVRAEYLDDESEKVFEQGTLAEFMGLLEQNHSTMHRVKDYASMMNIPSRKLNEVIKQYFGITAKEMISTKLYVESAAILQSGSDSIKEISYNLGFSSPYHFSNFFTKMKGLSPQSYRNQVR